MKIRTKFLLMMFLIVISSLGVILLLFQRLVIPWQVETLVHKTREIAYYLQQAGPLIEDSEKQQLLQKLLQEQQDLSYLVILDKNGKALFHSDPQRVGMTFQDQGTLASARDGKEVQQIYTRDADNPSSSLHGQKTVDILLPYYDHAGHHIGAIKVGLSLNRVQQIKQNYYRAIAISGAILLVIIFIITLKHINDVLFPLAKFTYMAKQLGEGEHVDLVSEKHQDELGLLAQEFNDMAKKLTYYMESLQNTERELKDYIDNLITFNGKTSPDGTLLLVNETATRYINTTPEQVIGKKLWETAWWNFDPETVAKLKKAVEDAASGQTVYFEAKNYAGPNKYMYVDFTLNPVLNDKNEVTYLVAEGRDITDRKSIQQEVVATNEELVATNEELVSIEEELRNSNNELYLAHQKLNDILESITDAFYSITSQWQVNYINAEAEKLLQKKKQEVIDQNLWDVFPETVNTSLYDQFTKVMLQQEYAHFEYFFQPTGKWFDINAYPSPDGMYIYFHDITDYKLAQEKLTYHNQYLSSLHETALALMNRLDLDELLEVIVARAAELLGTQHGWMYLVNSDGSEIVLRLGIGDFAKLTGFRMKSDEGLSGKVWQTGQPMLIDNYSAWPGRSASLNHLKIYGGLAAPLKSGSDVIGIIGIAFFHHEHQIEPEHLSKLTGFAQLASIALDNARLYNAAQQELAERKRIEEILRYLAYHDSLTDLPNRTLFNDRLLVALNNAGRNNSKLAILFLDLDYFKMVNDTLGHDMGDQLLKGIANKLSSQLRKGDTIARIGGDEFTILLQNVTKTEDAAVVAEKIIDSLKEPWLMSNHEFHITPSIGIALYPDDGADVESLLKNADAAMYQAKVMGRNNYQFYTPAMNSRLLQKLELENNLRRALERNEFIIHYQPQIEISTGRIVGVEALVRWQHPHWGLIAPGEFIPIAEDTGLILSIGEWVLRTACAQNKAWQAAGYPPIRITVNLSARQFQQQNLVQKVAGILKETGLEPGWLELEITESLAMKDVEFTGKTLFYLRKMGITIAIDDFGTGYSSLSYLKRLPIDIIKIDRSFIRDLTTDPDDASIVSTIIILAHNLKMQVIAEGVETEAQLNFLRLQQCDQMQGYLFSKPLPANELENLLTASGNETA